MPIPAAPTRTPSRRPRPAPPAAAASRETVATLRAERDALRAERDALQAQRADWLRGLHTVCAVAREAAAGNLEPRVLGLGHDGPLGELALAVNHLSTSPTRSSARRAPRCSTPPRRSSTAACCCGACSGRTATRRC